MATFAMGDIQGCYATFRVLLDHMRFSPSSDRLILLGDLVNRGPGSLEVMRHVYQAREHVRVVLGNHDLHVLGRWLKVAKARPKDTVDDLLAADDAHELLGWLRQQPLALTEGNRLFVHAGVHPSWTIAETMDAARVAHEALAGPEGPDILRTWEKKQDRCEWSTQAADAAVRLLRVFTLMRTVDDEGNLLLSYKGPPDRAPAGEIPWFDAADRPTRDVTVVCGHWAAMGLRIRPDLIALDSGCVWGGSLTAIRLDDGVVFQQPLRDRVAGTSFRGSE